LAWSAILANYASTPRGIYGPDPADQNSPTSARDIAEEVGDPDELCRAHNNLAMSLSKLGRSAEALTVGLNGCRLARRFGLIRNHAGMFGSAAEHLVWLGRWDDTCSRLAARRTLKDRRQLGFGNLELAQRLGSLAEGLVGSSAGTKRCSARWNGRVDGEDG
jgi:hypothetical protein